MKSARVGNWWFGRIRIQLRGQNLPALIALLHQRRIPMGEVRVSDRVAEVTVRLQDVRDVIRVCRSAGVKLRFVRREGFPFWRKRAKRRKFLVGGAVLFVIVLYSLSSFVWQVSVVGASEGTAATLLDAAHDNGLFVGAWRGNLAEPQLIQANLLKTVPNLVWVGVDIKGSRAVIRAVEKVQGVDPKIAPPDNVVATKPGVIRRVMANRGRVTVEPGQVVHPGQVLISGVLAEGDGTSVVPASGIVLAEVWYRTTVHVPLQVKTSGLTGDYVTRSDLVLGKWSVPVWGWRKLGNTTYEQDTTTNWHVGNWVLPIQWKRARLYAVNESTLTASEERAMGVALDLATQDVHTQMGDSGAILGQTVLQHQVTHGKLYATVLTRTEEDIGARASMPKVEPKPQDLSKPQN